MRLWRMTPLVLAGFVGIAGCAHPKPLASKPPAPNLQPRLTAAWFFASGKLRRRESMDRAIRF